MTLTVCRGLLYPEADDGGGGGQPYEVCLQVLDLSVSA
jgi:hypothetical protein